MFLGRIYSTAPFLTVLSLGVLLSTANLSAHPSPHPEPHAEPHPEPQRQTQSRPQPQPAPKPTTRLEAQQRQARIAGPQRNAPDNQTEPLPIGSVPPISPDRLVTLNVQVLDADTKLPLAHRVHIDDARGAYYPPLGHFDIQRPVGNSNNVSYEPDTINDGYDWAMIPEAKFTVHLPAVDDIQLKFSHGLEYPIQTFTLNLSKSATQTLQKTILLKRGANMRERGWMSADTHVHNLTPLGAIRQMPVEAIDYVNLMFIGPTHDLLRRGYVTGQADPVSTKDHIVYVSQEVRDANQGHMTLVGITHPITPIRVYTGGDFKSKPIPNEPLNWEVYDNLHKQNGLAYHAHYLVWPGWGSAVAAGLDKLDGLEWLSVDTASRHHRTRQNINVPGYGLRGAAPMWYDMLNCGAKLPIVGGTDKMSAGRVVGGASRTYVKVDAWSHEGFMKGMAAGKTFVTNGPLLHLTANNQNMGADLQFNGKGPFTVNVKTGCFTQKPIKFLELIVNGEVVHTVNVDEGQKTVELTKSLSFTESGWIAVRARHDQTHSDNWHHGITAAHSSPIYVTLNNELPAVQQSAAYMQARLATTLHWANTEALWSSDKYKQKALQSFKQAKAFYTAALQRSR